MPDVSYVVSSVYVMDVTRENTNLYFTLLLLF